MVSSKKDANDLIDFVLQPLSNIALQQLIYLSIYHQISNTFAFPSTNNNATSVLCRTETARSLLLKTLYPYEFAAFFQSQLSVQTVRCQVMQDTLKYSRGDRPKAVSSLLHLISNQFLISYIGRTAYTTVRINIVPPYYYEA